MKKKIMVFMLLLSFLVGMFGAVPVKAETLEHTIGNVTCVFEFNEEENRLYETSSGKYYQLSDDMISKLNEGYDLIIFYSIYNDGVSFCFFAFEGSFRSAVCTYSNHLYLHCLNDSGINQALAMCYQESADFESDFLVKVTFMQRSSYNNGFLKGYYFGGADGLYYSTADVYCLELDSNYQYVFKDELYYSAVEEYDFSSWCSDAGLNCAASSNETEDFYDFTFNQDDYHYIVRRNRISGSKYTWYLSQVTKDEDLIYYSTNRALADSKIGAAALYVLSGEYASGSTRICNYVYDSSGGGWLYTDNYVVDLGFTNDYFVDDIGISFSSSMPIVYSSTDIYSDKEQSSVYYAANTEYEDSEVVYPDISPTSTPTPTPISNSGSTELGGNVIAGGGIDFIISIVSSLWNRIYSIPMNVDGFQISLQQLYVYGILAGIVGAAIFAFTRRK